MKLTTVQKKMKNLKDKKESLSPNKQLEFA
jgi:hypothetical protein